MEYKSKKVAEWEKFHQTASNCFILQILPTFFSFLNSFQAQIVESIEENFAVVENTVMYCFKYVSSAFTS